METIGYAQNIAELVWVFVYPRIHGRNGRNECFLEVE